jgi:hypothetical protein
MTGTIDDTFAVSGGPGDLSPRQPLNRMTPTTALLEQAKGVLIFRYAIDADAAYSLIELWSAEAGVTVEVVCRAVVNDICQGTRTDSTDPQLVRWLEERLRHDVLSEDPAGG